MAKMHPDSFKADIVQRFLKGKDFTDFCRDYQHSRHSTGRNYYEPTKEHIALFDKFLKKQVTIPEASKAMGVTPASVRSRFAAIAFERLGA